MIPLDGLPQCIFRNFKGMVHPVFFLLFQNYRQGILNKSIWPILLLPALRISVMDFLKKGEKLFHKRHVIHEMRMIISPQLSMFFLEWRSNLLCLNGHISSDVLYWFPSPHFIIPPMSEPGQDRGLSFVYIQLFAFANCKSLKLLDSDEYFFSKFMTVQ